MKAKLVKESLNEISLEGNHLDRMGIGWGHSKKMIKEIIYDKLGIEEIFANFTEDKNVMWIEMDTFGMDDIFNIGIHFLNNKIKLHTDAADGTNMRKHNFIITAKSLKDFKVKMNNYWNIYDANEKRLSKREAEQLGIIRF